MAGIIGADFILTDDSLNVKKGSNTVTFTVTANDSFISANSTTTLTNKTLTSPTITTPTIATIDAGASTSLTLKSNSTSALILDTSQNLQFNSGYGSVTTAYGCRAWVNFNGTGTVAIRASGNVTSLTDNGVGDYTVNFTNAMPDTNYAVVTGSALNDSVVSNNTSRTLAPRSPATGSIRIIETDSQVATDLVYNHVAIFR